MTEAPTSAARSSLVMFAGTFTSRVLGMIRSPILLGAIVGLTTPVANAFDIANRMPTLIYGLVAGGLVNAVLVPAIVRAARESDDDGAAFINKLLTISMVALGVITVLLTIAAPPIVKAFAATLDSTWYSVAVFFAYWCLPQILFYGMYAVIGQVLNARENFGPYMWAPAFNNLIAIAGFAIILLEYGGVDASSGTDPAVWYGPRGIMLAAFSTLGIAAQALVLIPALRKAGVRYRPDFRWRNSGLGRAGKASFWTLLNVSMGMVVTAVLTNVAAGATQRALEEDADLTRVAGNFTYTISYALYILTPSLVVVSITTAIFPRLVRAMQAQDFATVRSNISVSLRVVGVVTMAAIAALMALAVPVSRLVLPSLGTQEVLTLSRVLMAQMPGLLGVGIFYVLQKVYYAMDDTRWAFLITLPSVALSIAGYVLANFAHYEYTVIWIVIATAVGNLLTAALMMWQLGKRLDGVDSRNVVLTYAKLMIPASISFVAAFGLVQAIGVQKVAGSVSMSFAVACGGGLLIVAIFLISLKLLRMPELGHFTGLVRKMIRR